MQITEAGFPYESLAPEGFDIRVLKLLPGRESDPVACTLCPYDQLADEGWTCLSYTWGTGPPTRELRINDCVFPVRSNVYEFLHEARRRGLGNIWIDSICINQSNTDERNAQVQLMSKIFSGARLVVVWLGYESPDLTAAFDVLRFTSVATGGRISFTENRHVLSHLSHAECTALFDACNAAVWTRRWVKQEILLPKASELWAGRSAALTYTFFAMIDALVDYGHPSPRTPSPRLEEDSKSTEKQACPHNIMKQGQLEKQCSHVLALFEAMLRNQRQANFPWLLEKFKDSACTDFRDVIYALRGLLEEDMSRLPVDYRIPKAGLFQDVLDFIAYTSHPRLPGSNPGERNLLANLYRGLDMYDQDLETIFKIHPTAYIVEVGDSFEMLRKTVTVYKFADSIIGDLDVDARNTGELKRPCSTAVLNGGVLHGGQTALYELRVPDSKEENFWLYGLQSTSKPDITCLCAAYSPSYVRGLHPEKLAQLRRWMNDGRDVKALAFFPGDKVAEFNDWLEAVRDQYVVLVTDSDDATFQLQISVLPGCDDEECLLRKWTRCAEEAEIAQ